MAPFNSVVLNKYSLDYLYYVLLNIYWFARSTIVTPNLLISFLQHKIVPLSSDCLNANQTLKLLLVSDKSFVRLGDGDLTLYFFHWKKLWTRRVRSGYENLLFKHYDQLILGIPDVINPELRLRPNINIRNWRFISFYFASLISKFNHTYGTSFAFRPDQYYPEEFNLDFKEFFLKLISNYHDIIAICDKKSSLNHLHSILSSQGSSVKVTLINVQSSWNIPSVDKTLENLYLLRDNERSQIVLLSYGHVSRWSSLEIIDMGFRIIDVGQLNIDF